MGCIQKEIIISSMPKGFHVITQQITEHLPEIQELKSGMLNVFLKHTSASLTINEDADPSVRKDFTSWFDRAVRENEPYYTHITEGPDDMPAHLKTSLIGNSLQIPVTNGSLNLGTWQGIYLCEHRNHGSNRKLVLTLYW